MTKNLRCSDPSQYHGLKGIFTITKKNLPLDFKLLQDPILTLRLENGNTGKIFITGSHQNWFYFMNQGSFPSI